MSWFINAANPVSLKPCVYLWVRLGNTPFFLLPSSRWIKTYSLTPRRYLRLSNVQIRLKQACAWSSGSHLDFQLQRWSKCQWPSPNHKGRWLMMHNGANHSFLHKGHFCLSLFWHSGPNLLKLCLRYSVSFQFFSLSKLLWLLLLTSASMFVNLLLLPFLLFASQL